MKAVIMAGGEGTRLRPMSLGLPKPMTPLLGRPVMEHIIKLLKSHNITDICVTLCYKPQTVMDYFGSGEQLGVTLTYFTEEQPLGTAGSVKNCMAHLGDEDFLVISGDCVCDLDLSQAIQAHTSRNAHATLVLYRHPTPLEYGLVVADGEGKIERFVEKPSWGQVVTNLINTGIYILSRPAMDLVPEGECFDFGKDLFPLLLSQGAPMYSCPLEGYWCDMGDCKAYLTCVCDALSGRVKLEMGLPQVQPGVWSAQPLPQGVSVVPPCWFDQDATLGQGSLVGPHAVLGVGAVVEDRSMVQRSILLPRAVAGPRATLYGAILCQDSVARKGCVLNEGAVLGENALAEEGAVLLEDVKLWPGQSAPALCRLARSITSGSQKGQLRFGDGGVIQGALGEDLGPEALLGLGSVLGLEGRVGLGCSESAGARMLARAAAAGITAAGGQAFTHCLDCPVQGAWLAGHHQLPVSLFVEEEKGRIFLHLFDQLGLPLGRAKERKIEHALAQGDFRRLRSDQTGTLEQLELSPRQWGQAVAGQADLGHSALRRITVAVKPDSAINRAIREALVCFGCHVEEQWRPGICAFSGGHGGFYLTAQDEKGAVVDPGQLLTLVSLIEMENGKGAVAVPAASSAAVDLVAAGYDGRVLRLDKDGEPARELYARLPWLWSAPSAAVRICARMGVSGQRLETLISKTPRFNVWKREVPLTADRGRVMQALAQEHARSTQGEGLRMRTGSGWVYLMPVARRAALRVVAEGPDLELAAELCDFYAGRAAQLDRAVSEQDAQQEDKK